MKTTIEIDGNFFAVDTELLNRAQYASGGMDIEQLIILAVHRYLENSEIQSACELISN